MNKKKEFLSQKNNCKKEENKRISQLITETNKKELTEKAEAKIPWGFQLENNSFSQISRLGKVLKNLYQRGFGFLHKYSFNEQEIFYGRYRILLAHLLEIKGITIE